MEVLTNHDKNSKKYHTRECYQTSDSMVSEALMSEIEGALAELKYEVENE